tara:strand:- start:967 stop:1377 length:411 start_codon:yes stop_codon:yes gene_type:complete
MKNILNKLCTIGDDIYVKESNIENAGYGLFAGKEFPPNTYITLYDGEIITRKEAWSRQKLSHMASREGIFVDGLKFPTSGKGGGSFSNSASFKKYANAEIVAWLGVLVIKSTKKITVDDEILVFYGRRGFKLSCLS